LAISKFADLDKLSMDPVFRGEVTGVTYLWKPGTGFSELAGGRLSGNNGVVASKDGKRLWVNDTGRQQIIRLTLDGSAPAAYAKVGFNPDNLRWAPDGTMLAAGQIISAENASLGATNGWGVARINPDTMAVTPVMTQPGRPEFSNGTVALQVGQILWLGNFRGDRVAYAPVK
jgi:sugar lactone lactonase YvrE